jgi:hypothetical protein
MVHATTQRQRPWAVGTGESPESDVPAQGTGAAEALSNRQVTKFMPRVSVSLLACRLCRRAGEAERRREDGDETDRSEGRQGHRCSAGRIARPGEQV